MKKRSFILLVLLVAILAVSFAGCGAPANGVTGIWYEQTGIGGTIEFKPGGVATMSVMGIPLDVKYTFDTAKGKGTMTYMGDSTDIAIENGKLKIKDTVYTRDVVKQQDIGSAIQSAMQSLGQ